MEFGIAGKWAIVCASSRGLGRSCADALAAEGVNVVVNGRDQAALDEAVLQISRCYGVDVIGVRGNVADEATRAELIAKCPTPDILVTNNAGPPPGVFTDWERDDWLRALEANMVAPLLIIREVLDGMIDRGFGRIVNVTSAMVTSPHEAMGLSSGARAGLTGAVKALSRLVISRNVTINNLLPERFDTDRQVFMAERAAKEAGVSFDEARRQQVAEIPARRLGRPEEFGAACAFLCSEHAGFMSGNNLHLDGGSYVGLI
jgi:3-oxoacyl-[acyl-carrier protein] reductase